MKITSEMSELSSKIKFTIKQKLMYSRLGVEEVTRNLSNQNPPVTIFISAPSLSMLPNYLKGLVSTVIKGLNLFIAAPAQSSSTYPQKLTQPPSFVPNKFEYINSDSNFDKTGSVRLLNC